jgi:hypothetical protein
MRRQLRSLALAVLLALGAAPASAALYITSTVGGAATGATLWNLDSSAPDGVTVTLSGNASYVTGSVTNAYAAPYLSGGNGTGFGSPDQANGVDTTQYLQTGSGTTTASNSVTIAFTSLQTYLGLLWGSVDAGNTIYLYNGTTLVGTITGSDVTASANGDQGANGTYYVTITSTLAFDSIVLTSTNTTFEFDNLAWGTATTVPEPMTIAIFGAGLLGLGMVRRRQPG